MKTSRRYNYPFTANNNMQLMPWNGQRKVVNSSVLDQILPIDAATGTRKFVTEIKIDFQSAAILAGAVIVGGTVTGLLTSLLKFK